MSDSCWKFRRRDVVENLEGFLDGLLTDYLWCGD